LVGPPGGFLAKYDTAGNLQWNRSTGPGITDVWADSSGFVYLSGSATASNGPGWDSFVDKYDAAGNLQWTRQFGTNAHDANYGISGDASGVYIVGMTQGDVSSPLSGLWNINGDAFLAKYDAAGNFQWAKQMGLPGVGTAHGVTEGRGISTDGLGNVYISGVTAGSLSGPSAGRDDAFLAKYDATGGLQWTRQFGTRFDEGSGGISANSLGNVYVAGYTSPGGGVEGDALLAKYDAAGSLQWSKQIESPTKREGAGSASVDGLGNVYISKLVSDTIGAGDDVDAVLAMYDGSGNLQWSMQIDPSSRETPWGVAADGPGSVYLTGWTRGSLGGPSAGDRDAFLMRVVPEPSTWALLTLGLLSLPVCLRRSRRVRGERAMT
jgi:hypothetical protein